jgi:hypothetical protein
MGRGTGLLFSFLISNVEEQCSFNVGGSDIDEE